MRKVILEFDGTGSIDEIQDLLAEKLELSPYYGRNLDALYDCLTEETSDLCIGIYGRPEDDRLHYYFGRLLRVFGDAEKENPHLCVFTERQ